MTVQEMVDEINSHGTTDEYGRNANLDFFYELKDLLDDNKEKEAAILIQGCFNCERETANNVLAEFKKQIYDDLKNLLMKSENL